ncbi:PIN domain-containing protein [Candidatus Rickettsia colombianensi]|uniref:hypothetical protein n=1 Tax=Candidatus Rickettsia colombianensi TaxID=1090944 RepID=UPI001FE825A5|nr:hypothetical protein [Candidatus Rickettsia colombianensi]
MPNFKKRINIYEPIKDFLNSITNINGLSIKDIFLEIAAKSISLMDDFHGAPTDRIIVATVKCLRATLLTRDQKILNWAKLGHNLSRFCTLLINDYNYEIFLSEN